MNSALTALAILLVSAAAGCSDATSASSVASIEVLPAPLVLQIGESCELHSNLFDASGGSVTGPKVTWTSSAPGILSITKAGKVTGVGAGSATVSAEVNGRTGTLAATVIPKIIRAQVMSSTPTVALGSTATVALVLYDALDNVINATIPETWTVDNSAIATVDEAGLLTPHAAGVVIVTARYATAGSLAVYNASRAIYVVASAP